MVPFGRRGKEAEGGEWRGIKAREDMRNFPSGGASAHGDASSKAVLKPLTILHRLKNKENK